MSAETAEHAGTPQSKQFLMVNTKTEFLREYTDQAISFGTASTDDAGVRPGPGLQLSWSMHALTNRSHRLQATSFKQQATSSKQQA